MPIPDVAFAFDIDPDWGNAIRDAIVPTGALLMWPTTTPPDNWLLCDGSTASRTTYSDLFDVVGVTFGVGDGSTTFNLPDYRARFPVGRLAADPNFGTIAVTGGAAEFTMTAGELPAHDHGGTTGDQSVTHNHDDAGHSHNPGGVGGNDWAVRYGASTEGLVVGTYDGDGVTFTTMDDDFADIGDASDDHDHTIASAGSGDPFSILPPFLVITFIIKT